MSERRSVEDTFGELKESGNIRTIDCTSDRVLTIISQQLTYSLIYSLTLQYL